MTERQIHGILSDAIPCGRYAAPHYCSNCGRDSESILWNLVPVVHRLLQQAQPKTCGWSRADDDTQVWETTCGHAFVFNDDGPVENNQKFCGYCGGVLEAEPCYTSSRMRPAPPPERSEP